MFQNSLNAAASICNTIHLLAHHDLIQWKTVGLDTVLKKCLFFLLLADNLPYLDLIQKEQVNSLMNSCVDYLHSCVESRHECDLDFLVQCMKGNSAKWMYDCYMAMLRAKQNKAVHEETYDLKEVFENYTCRRTR